MNEGSKMPKEAILANLHSKISNYYKQNVGYTKEEVLDAIEARDIKLLRSISMRAASISSGIYSRLM